MAQKTWGGRFTGDTDNRVEAFTESISFDHRLYRHDILASQAHARMLAEVGLLTSARPSRSVTALDEIAAEIERGEIEFSIELEDIHTHIEARPDRTARRRRPQAAHRPQPQRSGRHRCEALGARRHRRHRSACLLELQRALLDIGRARSRCDSARLHAHAAGPARAGGPLLPGLRREVPARPRTPGRLPQARQRAAARRRGPGRDVAAHRPRQRPPEARLRRRRRPTASTFPATAISCWSSSSI